MKIKELLNKLNIKISDNVNIDIHAVTNDSRKCDEHTLYINIQCKKIKITNIITICQTGNAYHHQFHLVN